VDGTFYVDAASDRAVRVPFMTGSYEHQLLKIGAHPGFKVIRMAYRGRCYDYDMQRFTMYIYLPNDRHGGLLDLVGALSTSPATLLRASVAEGGFTLKIPKFQASLNVEAAQLLQDLVDLPFLVSDDSFTEICCARQRRLYMAVTSVVHQCFLNVNEEGTVAAAATVAEIEEGFGISDDPPVDFCGGPPFPLLPHGGCHWRGGVRRTSYRPFVSLLTILFLL
jgi:serpin B